MNVDQLPELNLSGPGDLKYAALANAMRRSILAGAWPMGSKLPTEQDLVARTGMSLTTVRRAFQELVDEGLVERRRGAGTFVSPWRSRREPRRTSIGVMVPDTHQYFHHVIRGVQDLLTSAGAGTALIATYEWNLEQEASALRRLLDSGVEGLILTPNLPHDDVGRAALERLQGLPVPVVLAERSASWVGFGARLEHVISDHSGGAWDAVAHLHRLGHTRIGLVRRTGANTSIGVTEGYEAACRDLGLEPWLRPLPLRLDPDSIALTVEDIRDSDMTAVLVFGDREAARLQSQLAARGVRVPEDVAMVSYDDETADLAAVPLTAVAPPKYQLGQLAAEMLLRRIRNGNLTPLEQIQLRPVLVVRESCGAGARR